MYRKVGVSCRRHPYIESTVSDIRLQIEVLLNNCRGKGMKISPPAIHDKCELHKCYPVLKDISSVLCM